MSIKVFQAFFIILTLGLFVDAQADGEVKSLKLRLGEKVLPARSVADLQQLRLAIKSEKFRDCQTVGRKAENSFPEVRAWVVLRRLQCFRSQILKDKKTTPEMLTYLNGTWARTELYVYGSAARRLRSELLETSLLTIELEMRRGRDMAWRLIGQLMDVRDWMDNKQRARLFRLAGEISFAQQNMTSARDYFERSVKEDANPTVQARLDSLRQDIDPQKKVVLPAISDTQQFDATPEEVEIDGRRRAALKGKDYVAAVEEGIRLIRDFPGGKRASEAAKDILNTYFALAARSEESFQSLKDRVVGEMRKADGMRLYEWAQSMVNREYYDDALLLTQNSLEQVGGQAISTKVLLLAALSAQHSADFKLARTYLEKLIREHAGTRISQEAIYRLGILNFREEKYAESANQFERYLQLEFFDDFELSSLYWLWRAQQKLESPKATTVAERLMGRYPVSYYGLRARAELNQGKLQIPVEDSKKAVEWTFLLTSSEFAAYERFQLLTKAEWFEEAQVELQLLSEPTQGEGKVLYAYLASVAQDYLRASEVLNRAFAENPLLASLKVIQVAYPRPFLEDVSKEAQRYKIPIELVWALMKQESSFRTEVKSPAGALGLMQLMPVTAREVASDMRIKLNDITQDLYTPSINIRIGTQYLNRRLRAFDGHVPLALASYNAGIGNIRSWLRSREDLTDLSKQLSGDPRSELWVDELPWSETSGYIKSILRNYLVYKLLDQEPVGQPLPVTAPVWKYELKSK